MLRGPLDRDSLRLAVVTLPTAHQRLGWLAARLGELPGSGIVYALTVAAAQETAAFLREQGLTVASYTGRDEPEERARAEEDLLANRVKALVATSALGMGFDKPDLGFVVHLGAPQSPVAYYQQIGRAGRALEGQPGARAEVILLPGREDRDIWALLRLAGLPARAAGPRDPRHPGRGGQAAVGRGARDARGPVPRPARVHAQGARRGRRGAPGRRRLDRDRAAVAVRRGALRAGGRRARPRAAGHAGLPGHGRLPDGVPAPAARRSGRRAVRALRQLHRQRETRRRCPRPARPRRASGCSARA